MKVSHLRAEYQPIVSTVKSLSKQDLKVNSLFKSGGIYQAGAVSLSKENVSSMKFDKNALVDKFISPLVGFVKKSLHIKSSTKEVAKKASALANGLKNRPASIKTQYQEINFLALNTLKKDAGGKTSSLKGRITPPAGKKIKF